MPPPKFTGRVQTLSAVSLSDPPIADLAAIKAQAREFFYDGAVHAQPS
jgi:hypothetical protein